MTDDHLLERLGAALVPPGVPVAPPTTSVQDLHRVIDATRSGQRESTPRRGSRLVPIAVGGTVAVACAALTVVVTSTPRVGRETDIHITVTVTSPALGEVTERRRALEAALSDGDVAAVAAETARLRRSLPGLATGELAPIRAELEELLARADAFLERRSGGNDQVPRSSSTTSSTTQVPVVPVVTTQTTTAHLQPMSPTALSSPLATPSSAAPPSVSVQTVQNDDEADGSNDSGGDEDEDHVADDDSEPDDDSAEDGPDDDGSGNADHDDPGDDDGDSDSASG
jgi:hypothetical protein